MGPRVRNYIAKLHFYTEIQTSKTGTPKHSVLKMTHSPEHIFDKSTFDFAGQPGSTCIPNAEGLPEPPEAEMGIQWLPEKSVLSWGRSLQALSASRKQIAWIWTRSSVHTWTCRSPKSSPQCRRSDGELGAWREGPWGRQWRLQGIQPARSAEGGFLEWSAQDRALLHCPWWAEECFWGSCEWKSTSWTSWVWPKGKEPLIESPHLPMTS